MPDTERGEATPSSAQVHEALQRLGEYRQIVDLAGEMMDRGKPFQAAATFSRALALHAGDAETLTSRAAAHAALGDLARAVEDLDRALEIHANYVPALVRRGRLRLRLGDPSGALQDLDRAIERAATAPTHLDRGLARQAAGNVQGAHADYSRAIDLEPADPRAPAARGLLRLAEGNLAGATQDLRAALDASSSGEDRRLVRAVLAALRRLVAAGSLQPGEYEALAAPHVAQDRPTRQVAHRPVERNPRARTRRRAGLAVLASALAVALGGLALPPRGSEPAGIEPTDQRRDAANPREWTRPSVSSSDARTAIEAVEAGQVLVTVEDAEIFSGLDYDFLVAQGFYTREEAESQRRLDQAIVARSTGSTSQEDTGGTHDR